MDVLAELVSYLNSRIDVPVSTERPANKKRCVVVRRTGGSGTRFLERPRILVHCWADTDMQAATLAMQVSNAMVEAADHVANISQCTENSRYQNNLDDQHRWSAAFDLVTNR